MRVLYKDIKEAAVTDDTDDNGKATFNNREIEGIAKAIAPADLAALSPEEKNPSIPMTKDEHFYKAIAKAKSGAVYCAK